MLAGDMASAIDFGRKGLELARRFGLAQDEVRALEFIGSGRIDQGDFGGMDDMREALRIGLERDVPMVAQAYVNLADFVWEFEGPEQALELFGRAVEYSERRGVGGPAAWARAETTWVLYELGRWDELLRNAEAIMQDDPGWRQLSGLVGPD